MTKYVAHRNGRKLVDGRYNHRVGKADQDQKAFLILAEAGKHLDRLHKVHRNAHKWLSLAGW